MFSTNILLLYTYKSYPQCLNIFQCQGYLLLPYLARYDGVGALTSLFLPARNYFHCSVVLFLCRYICIDRKFLTRYSFKKRVVKSVERRVKDALIEYPLKTKQSHFKSYVTTNTLRSNF